MISTVTRKAEVENAVYRMEEGDLLLVHPHDAAEAGPPICIWRQWDRERIGKYVIALFGEQPDILTFYKEHEVLELLREADFAE